MFMVRGEQIMTKVLQTKVCHTVNVFCFQTLTTIICLQVMRRLWTVCYSSQLVAVLVSSGLLQEWSEGRTHRATPQRLLDPEVVHHAFLNLLVDRCELEAAENCQLVVADFNGLLHDNPGDGLGQRGRGQ